MKFNFTVEIGEMWIEVERGKIVGIGFGEVEEERGDKESIGMVMQAKKELDEYFEGKRQKFDLPIEFSGSEFQKKVWQVIRQIPYGQTMSYGEIAREINCKGGMRAVGQACGRNPVGLMVPCHRVVRSNGMLGGYSGELWRKEFLLKLEKRILSQE